MWGDTRVIVIVPAWNEAPRIRRVLQGIPAWVDAVVVIDDGSNDGTGHAARSVQDPRVDVVVHERNRGVGAAIATGYRRALADSGCGARDALVVMAGDGQMDPDDLPSLVSPIASGDADYVKGTRFGRGRNASAMPWTRRIGGSLFSWATRRATGLDVCDSQCGYTAIAREACGRLDLDGMWPRYGYPNDVLSQIALRALRVAEVPVRAVYADEVSRLRMRHVPIVAAVVLRAWARRWLRYAATRPARAR